MIVIPLSNIPNQSLSINLDNNQYNIRIHACVDNPDTLVMAVDIIRNTVVIVTGQRAISDFPLIPSKYLEDGNFIIQTMNDDYPDWRQFGITQNLIYASQDELNTIRGT